MAIQGPEISEILALRERLLAKTVRTPVIRCPEIEERLGGRTEVYAKLEFLQRTGTFKARGALATLFALSPKQLESGVTAVSAGNHAIATAFAADAVGTHAKVVMTRSANPARVAACRAFGADVVVAEDVHEAFRIAGEIQSAEGRYLVHPFDGPSVALGTGTVGVEICEQVESFDVLLVPVGGGGLIGGIANAVKQLRPDAGILGVEPVGADSMHRSFSSGRPESITEVRTIADSLGAPFAMDYSYQLTRRNVDEIVLVDDDALRRCMGFLFSSMKIVAEPACAATTAAALGPLRKRLADKRIVLVMCGSNIDWPTFQSQAVFCNVD